MKGERSRGIWAEGVTLAVNGLSVGVFRGESKYGTVQAI